MAKKKAKVTATSRPVQGWLGGSFAPEITQSDIDRYRELAEGVTDKKVKEAMTSLCEMCERFSETPASRNGGTPHPTGVGVIVTLEQDEIDRIDDVVPWPEEVELFKRWFDTIPPGETRNAAHHLLWYAVELSRDREPLTVERLGLEAGNG